MNLADIAMQNTVAFALGMGVGILAGLLMGWALFRAKFANPGSDMIGPTEPRWPRALAYIAVGILLFGLGMFAGFRQLEQKYNCLDDYASETADAIEKRQDDTELLQERDVEFKAAVAAVLAGGDPDGKELRRTVDEYLKAADQLEKTRADHPYPPPPREVC